MQRCTSARRVLTLALIALSAPVFAASTTVYKCFDSHLSLVYTDSPCKQGERIDIETGEVDLAAVSRLERARDMLDRAAAERLSDERRAAALGDVAAMMRYRTDDDRFTADYPVAAMLDYAYPIFFPFQTPRFARPRAPRHAQVHGLAPDAPFLHRR